MTKKIKIESIKIFITDTPKDIYLGSYRAVPVAKAVEVITGYINKTNANIKVTSIKYDEFDATNNAVLKIKGNKKDIYDFLNEMLSSSLSNHFNINF